MQPASRQNSNASEGVYVDVESLIAKRHTAGDINIFKPQLSRSMLLGDVRSRFRGRGMELEEVRKYLPGDDIRSIDWRVSARLGSTHTKLFAEERERPVHIVVDQRVNMFFGSSHLFKSAMAAEMAAIISWAALAGSDRIGGQVLGDHDQSFIRAKRTRQAVMHLLREIARFNNALPADEPGVDAVSLTDALQECKRVVRPGTAVFVLSDFADFDDAAAKCLGSIGRHTDVSLLRVTDPIEDELAMTGRVGVSDGKDTQTVVINDDIRERYLQSRAELTDALKNAAIRAHAVLLNTSTAETPAGAVSRLYRA